MTVTDIAQLSPEERLALIERLWDSLEPGSVPVRPAVLDELDRRLQSADVEPSRCIPWASMVAELGRRRL